MLRRVDVRARERERERVRVSFLLVITCNAVKRGHDKLSLRTGIARRSVDRVSHRLAGG